jgi:imidazolonepropionase-like amidohydrolase
VNAARLLLLASLIALAALLPAMLPEPVERARSDAKASPTSSTRFVIADARVFDGERTWPRASVQVADGRIEAIDESLPLPAGYERIDAAGRTLLPGLIDAHVHTWGEARSEALRFGVTTMLDMFSDHRQIAAARAERESSEATSRADLWSAGTLATAAGGHGTQFGLDVPTLASPDEAEAWVASRKVEGSDFIKIVREDLHTFTGRAQLPTLDNATAAAVITAAKRQGLRAVVHASGQEHARASLRDGADGLVHGFEDTLADPEFVALARERGAFVIATLTVVAGMAGETSTLAEDPRIAPYLTPGQRQTLGADFGFGAPQPRLVETARENIHRLHAGGVTMLAGSDAPNPNTAHGASLHEELEQLVRAGLSPQQALAAATSGPARAFGLDDRGRIAPGSRADLVLVDGDPLADITATRAIATIWKNGHMVDRAIAPVDAPAAAVLRTGPVSHFDEASLGATQGMDWIPTTDRIAGGASVVDLQPTGPGALASRGAMRIAGTVAAGAPWPWAGALYSPGAAPMQAVDGRAIRELVFQARGDGREYAVLLFSGAAGGLPAMHSFVAGPDWREVRVPLEGFRGAELGQLRAFAITAGLPHGDFMLEVDAVELH